VYGGTQYAIATDRRGAGGASCARPRQAPSSKGWAGRLTSTVEAFRLRQTDLTYSSSLALPGRSIDGLEFELSGRLRSALDMSPGFTFMRGGEVVPTTDFLAGRTVALTGLPARSLYVLGRYQLPESVGSQSRLGFGLGADSSRVAAFNNDAPQFLFTLPRGAQVDLSLERLLGPWTLSAFVRHAFDRQRYGMQADPRYVPLQPRRVFGLTAAYKD
jgi:hypothetical protein